LVGVFFCCLAALRATKKKKNTPINICPEQLPYCSNIKYNRRA
jgi:hypothetical protein